MRGVSFLREADGQWMIEERRPEWNYPMGISLFRTGLADEALPLLKEAIDSYPPGKHEAGQTLTQIYMDGRTRQNMEEALKLNTEIVENAALVPADRDSAWLQRAQLLLALAPRAESE